MNSLTSILYQNKFVPYLKPGQNVRIEPVSQFGYYVMPRSAVPELIPEFEVNLATPFTTSLSAMSDTGQTTSISTKLTDFDVPTLHLGHYRIFAYDPEVRFEIYQPPTVARFATKTGPISIHQGNTMWQMENQAWQHTPEIWVYEDKTPITIKAYSMNLDEATYYARIGVYGYKYPLALKEMQVDSATKEPLEPIALTIRVSERQ